jgi:hypothetical protein
LIQFRSKTSTALTALVRHQVALSMEWRDKPCCVRLSHRQVYR